MKRLILLVAALSALHVYGQEVVLPNPDAKVLGMGGIAMGIGSDAHALYGNAANAAFSRTPVQISTSYLGQGSNDYYAVSGACRFDNANLFQLGWRQYLRDRGNNDQAIDFGYSRRITERWAVGLVGRYERLKRPEMTMNALAVDLSAGYQLPLEGVGEYAMLRAGAKLSNLGGYLRDTEYSLPMNLTAGAALETFVTDAHAVTVGVDLGYNLCPTPVRGFQLSLGAEYNLMQLVQLRAGYHYGEQRLYDPSYASVGAGVRFFHLRLDFAYLFAKRNTLLRNTYSISFGLDF